MIIICNKLLASARRGEAVERADSKRDTPSGKREERGYSSSSSSEEAFAIKMCKIHDATVKNFMK